MNLDRQLHTHLMPEEFLCGSIRNEPKLRQEILFKETDTAEQLTGIIIIKKITSFKRKFLSQENALCYAGIEFSFFLRTL